MRCAQHELVKTAAEPLVDGRGRRSDHLRLSLTDGCNLACHYCTVGDTEQRNQRLDPHFAVALVAWLSRQHGVRYLRLTGGEPLLHPQLVELVGRLKELGSLSEITLKRIQMIRSVRHRGLTLRII